MKQPAEHGDARKSLGAHGEEVACNYLRSRGFTIVAQNYRCRSGEIDVIARRSGVLVFIEVKTRRSVTYGLPQLSVTPFKQRQLSKAALTYLSQNRLMNVPARFDVVAVLIQDGNCTVEHITDAFELAY